MVGIFLKFHFLLCKQFNNLGVLCKLSLLDYDISRQAMWLVVGININIQHLHCLVSPERGVECALHSIEIFVIELG